MTHRRPKKAKLKGHERTASFSIGNPGLRKRLWREAADGCL